MRRIAVVVVNIFGESLLLYLDRFYINFNEVIYFWNIENGKGDRERKRVGEEKRRERGMAEVKGKECTFKLKYVNHFWY